MMRIDELFTSHQPSIEWKERSSKLWRGSFEVAGVGYQVGFYGNHNRWMAVFGNMTRTNQSVAEALVVFGTISAGLKELISQHHPDVIEFGASSPSRAKLYRVMLSRALPGLRQEGYTVDFGDGMTFYIRKSDAASPE